MATRISTTRRVLLAGSAALPFAAAPGLALTTPDGDAELRRLWAQHREALARWEPSVRAADEAEEGQAELWGASDRLYEEVHAIERQIILTPAETLAGVAIKLRLWRREGTLSYQPGETVADAVFAAMLDAERLAGERFPTNWCSYNREPDDNMGVFAEEARS